MTELLVYHHWRGIQRLLIQWVFLGSLQEHWSIYMDLEVSHCKKEKYVQNLISVLHALLFIIRTSGWGSGYASIVIHYTNIWLGQWIRVKMEAGII